MRLKVSTAAGVIQEILVNSAVLLAVKSRGEERTRCLSVASVILERLYYLFLSTISKSYITLISALHLKTLIY